MLFIPPAPKIAWSLAQRAGILIEALPQTMAPFPRGSYSRPNERSRRGEPLSKETCHASLFIRPVD